MFFKNKIRFFYIGLILLIILFLVYKNIPEKIESEKAQNPEDFIFVNSFSAVNSYSEKNKPQFDISQIKTKKQKEIFDKKLRKEISKLIKSPLDPLPISKRFLRNENITDKGKYIEQKIALLTSNSSVAYAYILFPKNVDFPAPAVVAMHQHGGTKYGSQEIIGNIGDPTLFYAKELAERGYIVFTMDASSFGERKDASGDSLEIREKRVSQNMIELGFSPLGLILQEDIQSFNFLLSLKEVDKDNIGCIGHSFGGVRCLYLSALDKRVKSTVLSNSVGKFREDPTFGATQTWLSILSNIAKITTISGILALISPRPLMVLYSEKDPIYPQESVAEQIVPLQEVYRLFGQEQNLVFLKIPGRAHEFPLEYHEQAYEFFDKHLKNK